MLGKNEDIRRRGKQDEMVGYGNDLGFTVTSAQDECAAMSFALEIKETSVVWM